MKSYKGIECHANGPDTAVLIYPSMKVTVRRTGPQNSHITGIVHEGHNLVADYGVEGANLDLNYPFTLPHQVWNASGRRTEVTERIREVERELASLRRELERA